MLVGTSLFSTPTTWEGFGEGIPSWRGARRLLFGICAAQIWSWDSRASLGCRQPLHWLNLLWSQTRSKPEVENTTPGCPCPSQECWRHWHHSALSFGSESSVENIQGKTLTCKAPAEKQGGKTQKERSRNLERRVIPTSTARAESVGCIFFKKLFIFIIIKL